MSRRALLATSGLLRSRHWPSQLPSYRAPWEKRTASPCNETVLQVDENGGGFLHAESSVRTYFVSR